MKIDISKLLRSDREAIHVDVVCSLDTIKQISQNVLPEDVKEISDARLIGNITNVSGVLRFDGNETFNYTVECSRCLKKINQSCSVDVKAIFFNSTSPDADEEYTYTGKELDFTSLVNDEIWLNMPAKHLCSEDCKGFCPECGGNRNVKECGCKDEYVDPRLSQFGDLFK